MIVRYPPSPTGTLHVGTLRTCLYNYLYAKKHNGEIIFRSEDTDKERSKKEYEDDIILGLKNMGLMDDNTPIFRQSERTENYKKYLIELLESGKAYYCFMTPQELDNEREEQRKKGLPPRYSGKFRDYPYQDAIKRVGAGERAVIRIKVPENEIISFNDIVKGDNSVNSKELGDFVIARSLESPLYHITVVIDDHEMGITHVLRGEDHISNTSKQILIFRALGWDCPEFGHFPLILNEDKSKLSKRKNKVSVDDFLNEGYLPEALINFLALLGWNSSDEKEIFSLEELVREFSLEGVNKSGAIFDKKKLDWINSVYIKNLSKDDFKMKLEPFINKNFLEVLRSNNPLYEKVLKLSQERLKKFSEINSEFVWIYDPKNCEASSFPHNKMKVTKESAKEAIEDVFMFLEKIEEMQWNEENIKNSLISFIEKSGQKNAYYLWPLRVALTREQFSPGAFEVLDILGKEESMKRLRDSLTCF